MMLPTHEVLCLSRSTVTVSHRCEPSFLVVRLWTVPSCCWYCCFIRQLLCMSRTFLELSFLQPTSFGLFTTLLASPWGDITLHFAHRASFLRALFRGCLLFAQQPFSYSVSLSAASWRFNRALCTLLHLPNSALNAQKTSHSYTHTHTLSLSLSLSLSPYQSLMF